MEKRLTHGISYLTGGWPLDPKKTTLIFLHGAGGSGTFWADQVEDLNAQVNTIAPDLPGHGSSIGDGKTRIEDYARAVADFINRLNIQTPIVCGLSMGGAITQQLLLDYRDQIKAGILISTGARLKVAPVIFETIENDYNVFVEMIGKLAASKKTDSGTVQLFKHEITGCRPEITLGDFQACNRFDVRNRLSAIDAPVLVVSAQDDKLTPPKYADMLVEGIKTASRNHLMDAGHIVPLEKPEEVNQAVLEFIAQKRL